MIKQLTIKNLAIIDDITIDFEENLNVLTGETGAGKSIIIDAISLIFGARANNEIIAYGKDNAYISVALYLKDKVADYIYDKYDLDVKDECIITRTLSKTGKSSCKINGMIIPLHLYIGLIVAFSLKIFLFLLVWGHYPSTPIEF